jgi:hypothetical protein
LKEEQAEEEEKMKIMLATYLWNSDSSVNTDCANVRVLGRGKWRQAGRQTETETGERAGWGKRLDDKWSPSNEKSVNSVCQRCASCTNYTNALFLGS